MLVKNLLRRTTPAAIWVQIAVLILAVLVPSFVLSSRADAYTGGYVTSRSITLETSVATATDVIYDVVFTTATTHTITNVILQYCDTSPIVGDTTCGDTRSFDWVAASLSLNGLTGISASTIDNTNSTNDLLMIDVTVPASVTASTAVDFQLGSNSTDGVTNPTTTNSTFYIRILTFVSEGNADAYTAGTDANVVDAGGVALSTANAITVTAKVQETLTFCVYTGANCAAGGSSVAIGDGDGVIGTINTPANTTTDMDIATNATSGASVYMSGTLLLSGSNNIDSIGNTCTAESAGTESFGMRIDESGTTNFLPDAAYDCVANSYAFDTSAMDPTSTTTPYGDLILTTSGVPTASETVTMEFDGNASTLTPAGIYTATYDLVASATF